MIIREAKYYKDGSGVHIENPSTTYRLHKFLCFTWKTIEMVITPNRVIDRAMRINNIRSAK